MIQGIVNLGNTCYLASVLQMLRPAKDFSDLLKNYISGGAATAQFAATGQQGALRRLSLALKDFYNQWDQTVEAVSPFLLVKLTFKTIKFLFSLRISFVFDLICVGWLLNDTHVHVGWHLWSP